MERMVTCLGKYRWEVIRELKLGSLEMTQRVMTMTLSLFPQKRRWFFGGAHKTEMGEGQASQPAIDRGYDSGDGAVVDAMGRLWGWRGRAG